MAISREFAKKIMSSNGGSWLRLKNDGDEVSVRFMYKELVDMEEDLYGLHDIREDPKDRKTNPIYRECLRKKPTDPLDICPGCVNDIFLTAKSYLRLYDINEEKCLIWDRSYNYFETELLPALKKYVDLNPNKELASFKFIIMRKGVPHDKDTKYSLIFVGVDDVKLSDLPENKGAPIVQFEDNSPVNNNTKKLSKSDLFNGLV